MKCAALLVAVVLAAWPVPGHAWCGNSTVGIYAEDAGVLCNADSDSSDELTLYLLLMRRQATPLRELRILMTGWPDGGDAQIDADWIHEPATGELGGTLVWEWPEGVDTAPMLLLGTIHVSPPNGLWPGWDWLVNVETESLLDIYQQSTPVGPTHFVFNCTGVDGNCDCSPVDHEPESTAAIEVEGVSPGPGAIVGGTFDLSFHVWSRWCDGYGGWELPYTGSVLANDELVAELAGDESGIEQLTLDTGDLPSGSILSVRVLLDNGASTQAQLDYVVDTSTGVPDPPTADGEMSVSAIKSRY